MTELILSLEGTAEGRQIALWLALLAAFCHALMSALQKGRFDPWLMRGGMDLTYGLIALPLVIFVAPFPAAHLWPFLIGSFLLHSLFKLAQGAAFSRGAFTVVYPTSRGTGALVSIALAWVLFGETLAGWQWAGLALLITGIGGLALWNLRYVTMSRETLAPALAFAGLTGALVALYTSFDAWGLRASGPEPFSFIAWFFLLDSLLMPFLARHRFRALPRADLRPMVLRAIAGGVTAWISFGSILIATRIGNLAEAAVVRETATVFAALLGWLILGERSRPQQIALMGLIALGAIGVKLFATAS